MTVTTNTIFTSPETKTFHDYIHVIFLYFVNRFSLTNISATFKNNGGDFFCNTTIRRIKTTINKI